MPDHRQLALLTRLRKAARVTLAQMARACGLQGGRAYESAGAWERGEAVPRATVREAFLGYLAHTLNLAADREALAAIWEVLVHEWGWEPLHPADWQLVEAGRLLVTSIPRPLPHTKAGQFDRSAPIPISALPDPAPLPPGSVLPFAPNPHFVGRTRELMAIAETFQPNPRIAVAPATQMAITGPGGIGKTQLAIEFAHRFGQFFPGGVFWLSFANPDAVPATVAACGITLELRPGFARLSLDEQMRLVTQAWEEDAARLLIFDNCEDDDLLARWLPQRGGCRTLVTSRRTSWGRLAVSSLSLGLLSRAASVELLRRHCPVAHMREEDLVAIAAELDDLPLALHLAGSYLARGIDALSPGRYLGELRQTLSGNRDAPTHPSLCGEDRSGRLLPAPTDHLNHLEQTFALSLSQLDLDDPLDHVSRRLLLHAAWFAPGEPVPIELLLLTLPEPPVTARSALRRLVDIGLVLPGGEPAEATIRVHRLVCAYLRQQHDAREVQQAVEGSILQHMHSLNTFMAQPALLRIQVHLRAITDSAFVRSDATAASLSFELSRHFGEIERYAEAITYLKRSQHLREAIFGQDAPESAENFNYEGELLEWMGEYPRARPYHDRSLAIRLHLLGLNHPDTAYSYLRVGESAHALCDYKTAQKNYEQALIIRASYFGPDSPTAAELYNNLGLLLNALGDLDAALPHAERAVAIWEAQAQPNRSLQSMAINNLGYLHRARGEYAKALPILQRALTIREQVYGPANTFIGVTRNHIGRVYHYQGRLEQAMAELEATLRLFDAAIGREHPITACTLSNAGMLALETGDLANARRLLEEALKIHRRLLGAEHRHVARGLSRLGLLHQTLGDAATARYYFREALAIRRRILGELHHDTANTLGHLGMLQLTAGRPRQARSLLAEALRRHLARLGEGHPYTARSLLRMGQLCTALGERETACAHLSRALAVYTAVLGLDHPYTMVARRASVAAG